MQYKDTIRYYCNYCIAASAKAKINGYVKRYISVTRREKMVKKMLIIAGLTLILASVMTLENSSACSAIYVGSKASADGAAYITRSNDSQGVVGNHIIVKDRVENEPGRTMPVDISGKTQAKLPKTIYRYVATPYMDSGVDDGSAVKDAAVCTNEYGVSMTMSITAFSNKKVLAADPLIETGLAEDAAADLVICQSRTAREAVKVLFDIIDEFGSSEVNIALIADRKEVWYAEMYSGHQYAAVKLPPDKVAAFGNEFNLEYLSDYEESITSKDLITLPKKNGFAVYGKNKELNLWATYAGPELTTPYSHMRTWIGHRTLAPSAFKGDYAADDRYPLCFKPDQEVSQEDIFKLMRNRYEGTEYSPDKTGRKDMRVIGSETSRSVHVVRVDPKLPAGISSVIWEVTGPAPYGIFVPVSNAVTSIDSAYGSNQPKKERGIFDAEHYPYYAIKGLNTLCGGKENHLIYGKPVSDYFSKAEQGMYEATLKVLENAKEMYDGSGDDGKASEYITAYCNSVQDQAFKDVKKLYNDVVFAKSENSNSFKMGKNPETAEVLDEEVKDPPMEVDLDPARYNEVPDPDGNYVEDEKGLMIASIVLALLIVAIAVKRFKWK